MKKALNLALLLALGTPMLADAASWVQVGGNDIVTVFIDNDTIRQNGSRVKMWVKWQYSKPQDVPYSYPKKSYQSKKSLQISDCANGKSAFVQGIYYAGPDGGEVVGSFTNEEHLLKFSESAPETFGELISNLGCNAPEEKRRRK